MKCILFEEIKIEGIVHHVLIGKINNIWIIHKLIWKYCYFFCFFFIAASINVKAVKASRAISTVCPLLVFL